MKIAILTSGRLPVPAVLGGAVENLTDYYLEYNNAHHLHDITVYSIKSDKIIAPDTDHNHYHYIDTKSKIAKIRKRIYAKFNKETYYDSGIEYFLHRSLQHLKKQSYDYVILENRPGFAMAVKRVTNAKIVLHLHNDLLNKDTYKANEIAGCLSKVITVSNFIKGRVETIGAGIPVETVYNGIDLERFQEKRHNTSVTRSALGLADDDFVAVYSGRLTKEKGIKELLEAFLLLKDYPQLKLLVIGGSFYGDVQSGESPFIVELQQIAENMRSRISFTGFVDYESIPDYLSLSDVAIIPSMWDDPFPTTVLEAMAAGLPIIATKSGGIPESCGDCAILIDTDNSFAANFTQAIIKLFDDALERKAMGEHGAILSRRYAKEHYAQRFISSVTD